MASDMEQYYRDYYNKMGKDAYTGERLKNSSRMRIFTEWLRATLKPGDKVLDIGCGDAIFAELMPEFEWFGVDINTERAKSRISGTYDMQNKLQEHDLMQTPYDFDTGMFDAIICSEVLEHIWDLRVVHREAKRLLKREGTYIISTPNYNWLQNILTQHQLIITDFKLQWTAEHIRNYTHETHKKFLAECGFIVDKETGADMHYDPVTVNICQAIKEGLEKAGVAVDSEQLHTWAGQGIPHLSHTAILQARKA